MYRYEMSPLSPARSFDFQSIKVLALDADGTMWSIVGGTTVSVGLTNVRRTSDPYVLEADYTNRMGDLSSILTDISDIAGLPKEQQDQKAQRAQRTLEALKKEPPKPQVSVVRIGVNAYLASLLAEAARRGIVVGVASLGESNVIWSILGALGLRAYVRMVAKSEGFSKLAALKQLASMANARPSELLFIDDDVNNIADARGGGYLALQVWADIYGLADVYEAMLAGSWRPR